VALHGRRTLPDLVLRRTELPIWRRPKTSERDARFSVLVQWSVDTFGEVQLTITSFIRSERLAMPGSRQQRERCGVTGPYDTEVPLVKGGDLGGTKALSDGNDRRVHCTKTEIGVLLHQLRRPFEVGVAHVFDIDATGNEAAEEGSLHWCLGTVSK
jgi:hypothetical protein